MTNNPEFYYEEIEAYIANNEEKPATYAHVLGVSVDKFLWMAGEYKKMGREMNTENLKQTRKHLTEKQKEEIHEAIKAGGTLSEISKRFSVSVETLKRADRHIKEKKARYEGLVNVTPTPDPLPDTLRTQIYGMEDVAVSFEGEDVVIRIPRKNFVHELLKGVL